MTITAQAVREMAERLREHVDARGGSSLENGFWQRAINASNMLVALVEERNRLAAELDHQLAERAALTARAEAAEAALREMRSEEMIERVARAWATMDGKADLFDREKGPPISEHIDDPTFTGAYEGYMEEAREAAPHRAKGGRCRPPRPDQRGRCPAMGAVQVRGNRSGRWLVRGAR